MRKNSETYLKCYSEYLSDKNKKAILVPEGFAHGFITLKENCELIYLHSNYYSQSNEKGVRFNDPLFNIKWPIEIKVISDRDRSFKNYSF